MNIMDDELLKSIKKTGENAYLVGGYIRDYLLGKSSTDRDIVVKNAENFSRKLAENLDATFIVLDSENQIYRVVLKDKTNFFDISEPVGGNIIADLSRRDFTINAIAYDIQEEIFIDIEGGINDIKSKTLRQIKNENFEEDPLRVLRAFRFASTTGFTMSDELKDAILKYKHLLNKPAIERINYEIMKLFGGKYCSKILIELDNFGILEEIFPNVNEMKKVPPNSHHHLDLFHHVVETVKNIEEIYKNLPAEQKIHLDSIDFGGYPRINHLKLAGFLHDIGKFSTWTIEDTGRHRFIKHDDIGAKICVPLLKKLKFSKKQIEYISFMIKTHIYPSNVLLAPDLNEKIMMRYIRKMENNVIDNIVLAKADRLSARGEDITDEIVQENLNGLDKLLNFYIEKKDSLKPLPILLNGNQIMALLKISPSPKLGKIINALHEAQLNSDVQTEEDAIKFVKNLYNLNKL